MHIRAALAMTLTIAATFTLAACQTEPWSPGAAPPSSAQPPREVAPEAPVTLTLAPSQPLSQAPQDGWLYIVELDPRQLDLPPFDPILDRKQQLKERALALQRAKDELLARHKVAPAARWYAYPTLPVVGLWLSRADLDALLTDKAALRAWPGEWMQTQDTSALNFIGLTPDQGGDSVAREDGLQTTVAVIDTPGRYWEPAFGGCGAKGAPDFGAQSCAVARRSNHMDCARLPQIAPGWECVPGADTYDGLAEQDHHGTNVSGIVHSVAPGAKLWMLNAAHRIRPVGSNSAQVSLFNADVLAALEEIHADPGQTASINMSLGSARAENQSSYCASAFHAAMRDLWHHHNILSVVAAGNSGTKNALASPACDTYAVTVGAQYDTDYVGYQASFSTCAEIIREGAVTCFSNSQHAIDLVAPGGWITAAGVTQAGTSQATPHVAGFAARLQSFARRADRPLPALALLTRLRGHSTPLTESAHSLDGAPRQYRHRALSTRGAITPTHALAFHADPSGYGVAPGQQAAFQSESVDLQNRAVRGAWLDLTIATTDASRLEIALISPEGARWTAPASAGANLNQLFGDGVGDDLRAAFQDQDASGAWTLQVRNLHTQEVIGVLRAALLLDTEAVTLQAPPPSTFASFSMDAASIAADGAQPQTLRVRIANAERVTDLRLIINHPRHVQNGQPYSGYFRVTPTGCHEVTASFGNQRVKLLADQCAQNALGDGVTEYVLPFAAEPDFPVTANHQISLLWFEGDQPQLPWTRVTTPGAGFDVTAPQGEVIRPSTFDSFSMDAASVPTDGITVQTLRVVLNDGARADDLRLLLNHPAHAQNGLTYGAYLRFTPDGCHEVTQRFGNDKIALLTDQCARNELPGGQIEFVLPFTLASNFGAATNHQVSLLWFEGGSPRTTWRRVTDPGAGFDSVTP